MEPEQDLPGEFAAVNPEQRLVVSVARVLNLSAVRASPYLESRCPPWQMVVQLDAGFRA